MTIEERLQAVRETEKHLMEVLIFKEAAEAIEEEETISGTPIRVSWGSDWESDDEGGSYIYVYSPVVHTVEDEVDCENADGLREVIQNYLRDTPKYDYPPSELVFTPEHLATAAELE